MGGTLFSYENTFNYFNYIDGKIDSAPGTIQHFPTVSWRLKQPLKKHRLVLNSAGRGVRWATRRTGMVPDTFRAPIGTLAAVSFVTVLCA